MKRSFAVVLAAILLMSAVGCSDTQQTQSMQSDVSSVVAQTSSTEETVSTPKSDLVSEAVDDEQQKLAEDNNKSLSDLSNLLKDFSPLKSTATSLPDEDVRKICELYVDMLEEESRRTVDYSKTMFSYIKGYGDAHYVYVNNVDENIAAVGIKIHCIDGYWFFNMPYNSSFFIYKNGQLNSVEEAEKIGWITEEQKKDIMWLHLMGLNAPPTGESAPISKEEEMRQYIENALKTYKPLTYEKKPLSDEMINKIKTDYIKACKKTGEWTVEDIRLDPSITYGDAYRMEIGYITKGNYGGFGPSITVMHGFTVFGYRLHMDHGAYHRTRIYKDGKFYQLKEACEEEILDRKYIVDIIVKYAEDDNFRKKYLGQ